MFSTIGSTLFLMLFMFPVIMFIVYIDYMLSIARLLLMATKHLFYPPTMPTFQRKINIKCKDWFITNRIPPVHEVYLNAGKIVKMSKRDTLGGPPAG